MRTYYFGRRLYGMLKIYQDFLIYENVILKGRSMLQKCHFQLILDTISN